MSSFENFVQCRIVTPLAASATDVALYAAVAPYRLPPEAGGVLVLTDSPGNPSVVEVVRYSHRTGLALYGLQRGQEGTTARDWTGPVFCYQALMAGDFQSILDELNAGIDGKVDKAAGQSLMTDAERTKLAGIQAGAQVNSVTSVAGKTGAVSLTKADVGLGNVDNTSDASKPVSTAQQTALNAKVDKVTGKGLSTNDLTAALLTKLNAAAPLASPALTGNPTAPTPAAEDADTSIATTAFVRAAMALFGIGTDAVATVTDLDALVMTGLYKFTLPSVGGPFNYGTLINISRAANGNEITQFAVSVTTDQAKFRRKVSGTWSAWQEIWHTGNLVKQSSPTDLTPDALMGVGAFGWGNNVRDIGSGLITDQPTGAFYQVATPENVFPTAGPILNLKGTRSFALFGRASRAYMYTYGETPVLMKLFHDQNILGTVSQAGGVPTGAIIERGSNANGEYVRFADGTQICSVLLAGFELVAAGAIYRSAPASWVFPAPFARPPTCYAADSSTPAIWGCASAGASTNSASVCLFYHAASANRSAAVTSIGRWF